MKTTFISLLLFLLLGPANLFANIASGTIDVVNPDGVSGLLTSDHNGLQYTWEDLNATSLNLGVNDRVIWQASNPNFVIAKVNNDIVLSANTSGNQVLTQHDVLIVESGVTLTGNIFSDEAIVYLRGGSTLDGRIVQAKGSIYGYSGAHITDKLIMQGVSGSRCALTGVTVDNIVRLGPFVNFVELSNNTFKQNLVVKDSWWIYIETGNTIEGNVVIKDNPGLVEFNGNSVIGTTTINNTSMDVEFTNNDCVNDVAIKNTGGDLTVESLRLDNSPFAVTNQDVTFANNAGDITANDLTLEGLLKFVGTGGAVTGEEWNAFDVVVKNNVGTVDWLAGIIDETVKVIGNQDEVNIAELEIGTDVTARLNTGTVYLTELDIQGHVVFKENSEMDFQLSQVAENFTSRDNLGPVFCDVIDVGVNFKSIDDADITYVNGDVGGNLTITNPGICLESNNNVVGTNSGCPPAKTNHFSASEALEDKEDNGFSVSVYPQPAFGELNIAVAEAVEGDRLEVIDVQGRTIHQVMLQAGGQKLTLDGRDWPAGLYILRISGPSGQLSKRLLMN